MYVFGYADWQKYFGRHFSDEERRQLNVRDGELRRQAVRTSIKELPGEWRIYPQVTDQVLTDRSFEQANFFHAGMSVVNGQPLDAIMWHKLCQPESHPRFFEDYGNVWYKDEEFARGCCKDEWYRVLSEPIPDSISVSDSYVMQKYPGITLLTFAEAVTANFLFRIKYRRYLYSGKSVCTTARTAKGEVVAVYCDEKRGIFAYPLEPASIKPDKDYGISA